MRSYQHTILLLCVCGLFFAPDVARLAVSLSEHWLALPLVLVVVTLGTVWLIMVVESERRIPQDDSPPTQYPDGTVFVSNRMTADEFRRVGELTRQQEMAKLMRSDEWRNHVRQHGQDLRNYNWQARS